MKIQTPGVFTIGVLVLAAAVIAGVSHYHHQSPAAITVVPSPVAKKSDTTSNSSTSDAKIGIIAVDSVEFLFQIEAMPRLMLRRYSTGKGQDAQIKMNRTIQKWLGREFTELETTSF